MKSNIVHKVILDVDPGVDDTTCMLFALTDPQIDVKLITIEAGNVPISQSTKTALFILDMLNKDVPVVRGPEQDIERALFLHSNNAIGGYKLPRKVFHKETKMDIADAMYDVIKQHPHEVTLLLCSPQTNVAALFEKHKDAPKLIKQIIFMGGSFGLPGYPQHISYNARTAPLAFKKVLDAKVPSVMIPSGIGRTSANFSESQVKRIGQINSVGKFLERTFATYWEPGFDKKFVSNNDICTYLYLVRPQYFETQQINLKIDCNTRPGYLTKRSNPRGPVALATKLDRRKFIDFMLKRIEELSYINLDKYL